MNVQEYLKSIGLNLEVNKGVDENAYVADILTSDDYGKVFSKLENSDDLDLMYDNQVLTEEGSSLVYESLSEPYLLNLIADFTGDVYQLIINVIEE